MRDKYLVFGAPFIGEEEIAEVEATLRSGWIGTGPKTAQFENDFAAYLDVPYAVAVSSCTAALHLSILALGLKPGDEVITTPFTFCATANAVLHAKAIPVFADVEKGSWNLDPEEVRKKITSKTKAILPVHMYGRPCNMEALKNICHEHNLKLIGDCAHAVETKWQNKPVAQIGDLNCFSFYPTKNVVTIEGGIVTTHDENMAATVKRLALHGLSKDAWKRFSDSGYKHYQVVNPGYKYNMTDVQSSLGIHQLARVEKLWKRREEIWKKYQEAFIDLPVERPVDVNQGVRHAYHLYTLNLIPGKAPIDRDTFMQKMHERNIGTGVHYIAIHLQPYYQETFQVTPGSYPNAEYASETTISLPLSGALSDQDVDDVIEATRALLS